MRTNPARNVPAMLPAAERAYRPPTAEPALSRRRSFSRAANGGTIPRQTLAGEKRIAQAASENAA